MWYDIQRIKGASRLPICLSSYEFSVIVGQWQYRFIMISVHTNLHSHKQNQIHFEFPTKSLSVPQILLMRAKHKRQTLPYTDAYHWFLIPFWFFESPHGLQTADGYPTALPRLGHRLPKNHFRYNHTSLIECLFFSPPLKYIGAALILTECQGQGQPGEPLKISVWVWWFFQGAVDFSQWFNVKRHIEQWFFAKFRQGGDSGLNE